MLFKIIILMITCYRKVLAMDGYVWQPLLSHLLRLLSDSGLWKGMSGIGYSSTIFFTHMMFISLNKVFACDTSNETNTEMQFPKLIAVSLIWWLDCTHSSTVE